ncbi:MAG: Unknown protein, partial [uncultured Sulfurovum sp.]
MKKLLFFILLLPLFLFSFDYATQWQTINALNKQSLPKSALEKVNVLYTQAKKDKNVIQIIRATLYKKNYISTFNQNGEVQSIQMIEETIKEVDSIEEKSILYSILAEVYQSYYEKNYYKIGQRTQIKKTVSKDLQTWSSKDFLNKIYTLYQKSLNEHTQNVNIEKYQEILSTAKNVEGLRPTLYDLLVFRAMNYFNNEQSYLHQVKSFKFTNKNAFSSALTFSKLKFQGADQKSLKYQNTLLYQKLLKFYLNNNHQKALEHFNLKRLTFVKHNFVAPNAQQHYLQALNQLLDKDKNSEALRYLINHYHEQEDYTKALELIKIGLVSTNPFVNQTAKNVENNIKEKQLRVNIERVNLPHENLLSSIAYRNLDQIFVKVFKLSQKEQETLNQRTDNKDNTLEYLKNFKALKTLHFELPKTKDYQVHTTEVSLESYDIGNYIFLFSSNENFNTESFYQKVKISNLSYFQKNEQLLILHRKSGLPLAKVKVLLTDPKGKVLSKLSNAKGFVDLKTINKSYRIRLEHKNDILDLNQYLNRSYPYTDNDENQPKQVHFFTDRSIYRPGQTIYFKGLLSQSQQKKKPKVLTEEKVLVHFNNTNGQKIDEKTFISDQFGTFHGQFTAPKSGLLGSMSLSANVHGRTHFRVEEYKRPKFEITFESNKKTYNLGESIILKGLAKAYAGNFINHAKVKFTIERQTQYPWRHPFPHYPNFYGKVHLSSGTVQTNEKGEFNIPFKAVANTKLSSQKEVNYLYVISVEVTDNTGETQNAKKIFNIGQTNLKITMRTSKKQFIDENNSLTLETNNLNGEFKAIKGYLNIEKVIQEKKLYRERYWSQGDKKFYSKEAFEKRFPHYRYEPKEKTKQFIETFHFDTNISKTISLNHLPQGEYILTLNTTNQYAEELTKEKRILRLDNQNKELFKPSALSLENKIIDYKVGEQAKINIKSSLPKAEVLFRLEQYGEVLEEKWINLENFHQEVIDIKKSYQGNIYYSVNLLANNRHFTEHGKISVPWDSELKVEYLSFRDKLKPN